MTPSQLAVLKTLVLADPTAAAYYANGNDTQLADWLNINTTYVVWRSALTPEMSRMAIVVGAIQLDNLTVGKRDTLLYIAQGNLDVTQLSVRQAIDDLCGSQATLKTALQDAQKRVTTRAEKALATGTGTTAVPALLGWEGVLDQSIGSQLRGL